MIAKPVIHLSRNKTIDLDVVGGGTMSQKGHFELLKTEKLHQNQGLALFELHSASLGSRDLSKLLKALGFKLRGNHNLF